MLPNEQTPWQQHGGYWVKRDDLFEVSGSRGGKVRTCLALAQPAIGRTDVGLVTAGSRQSPQVNIVATVAAELGLPCQVHVPAGPSTPELEAAEARGADIVRHRPGHNSVIVARARMAAADLDWIHIPFGMECEEAVRQTSRQVTRSGYPPMHRLVVPVGSGMSLAGILHGLDRINSTMPVLGVVVGASPEKRLDRYAPVFWRQMVDLQPAGLDYHAPAPEPQVGLLALDPIYEGKCVPFLRPGDGLWVVGCRETATAPRPRQPADSGAPAPSGHSAP